MTVQLLNTLNDYRYFEKEDTTCGAILYRMMGYIWERKKVSSLDKKHETTY
jgi:hypothetical protein